MRHLRRDNFSAVAIATKKRAIRKPKQTSSDKVKKNIE
jgi:hypothetical protein